MIPVTVYLRDARKDYTADFHGDGKEQVAIMKMRRQITLRLLTFALVVTAVPALLGVLPDWNITGTPPVQARTLLWEGTSGAGVRSVQSRLKTWGYYNGALDGIYGRETTEAVRNFQAKNGLAADGAVGAATWAALGLPATGVASTAPAVATNVSYNRSEDLNLLSRVVAAEAEGEPLTGQVAVAAVILNRVGNPSFPSSLSGVIYQPHAFESVSNGLIWRRTPDSQAVNAARQALNGWDPTYGCIFFWNPAKPVSSWIWSRQIVTQIGNHVFAR